MGESPRPNRAEITPVATPRLLGALLLLSLCSACSRPASRGPANVVVICIDVLRADHVGSYGYSRATTPAIDALAAKGITFESAISAAAWTKPSVPSYFTSRFPHQHGVYRGSYWRDGKLLADALGPDEVTLAELFAEHGYRTLAVVANPVVDPALGLAQGFDEFVAELRSATELRERFLTRLEALKRQQPFFAYIHFNDVHLPYQQPEPYRSIFGDTESPALTELVMAATVV